jgi:flagellin-like hook-associated protein FlgL
VLATVQSVNTAAGTMTAIFSGALASNAEMHAWVYATSTGPVAIGQQLMTLTNTFGGAVPLYVGEVLQINPTTFANNDVVLVQKVVSSNSFIATFNKAQPGGVQVYNINFQGTPTAAGNYAYNFGATPADSAPDGTPIYIEEYAGAFGANTGQTQVVEVGDVTNSTPTIEYYSEPGNPQDTFAGGNFEAFSGLGDGNVPVVNTVDGTIELKVIESNGRPMVQESFYDTATQLATTSTSLLSPGESAELYDGVLTTLGNFSLADVGSTAYIKVLQSVAATTTNIKPDLQVQSAADEGDVIQIAIPAVNTNTLRVSTVTVIGASGTDPTLASEDAIGQCDYALQQVTTVRAQIGAEIVRLGIDETNDDTAATELTASQSNITDLNVGSATTEFTEQQIDIDVATSMLAQVNSLQDDLLRLFQEPPP